jgi:DNA invertase Pin-like site-specific DNA recombinase
MAKPRAYSYLRFSTPEQLKGDSFRRQTELSQQYALKNNLSLDESLTFKDLGVSAFHGKNVLEGELGAFIKAVDSGQVCRGSYLLVESLDRLSRDRANQAYQKFNALLEKGIKIVTLQDEKVYTQESINENFTDMMMSLMIMFRAHEESLTKSTRIRGAWANKRKQAQKNGKKLTARCPAWLKLNKEKDKFEVDRVRAKVIKKIFKMTLDGLGKGVIAKRFNSEGIKTFGKSLGWHSSYIQKILDNPAVIGEYQPMKVETTASHRKRLPDGDPLEDYFPPVIPKETFFKAKETREGRRIERGRTGKRFSNLFTGLAICGSCNGSMHFINKGQGNSYLVCSNSRNGLNKCKSHSWRYKSTQAFILITLKEVDYRELSPSIYSSSRENLNNIEDTYLVKKNTLVKTETNLTNVVDLLAERPDSPKLKEKLDELEQTKMTLQGEVDTLETQIETEKNLLNNLDHDHKEAKDAFKDWIDQQRSDNELDAYNVRSKLHQHLKKIVEKAVFYPSKKKDQHGSIEVFFLHTSDYKRIIRMAKSQQSAEGIKIFKNKEEKDNTLMEVRDNRQTYNLRMSR